MFARKHLLQLSLLSMLAAPLSALADPVYSMTFLPRTVLNGVDIDNRGRVAVTFQDPAISEAGIWSGGSTVTGLGFLGTSSLSVAFDMSTNGKVSGYSEISPGPNFGPHAFVYANGAMIDLGTLGGERSIATAVNDFGQAAGDSNTATGASHAFRYSNGVLRDLGTLGGPSTEANAINNPGVVVGSSNVDAEGVVAHAYMTCNCGELLDLGTLPGGTTRTDGWWT
jgi:probable HAF family extracellular repeat protein